jgi:uncharacterized protein (DUF433 family)
VNGTIWAFSAEQVCRLTSLSLRQLRYWDRTKFFCPQYGSENRRDPFSRVYSYRDLVSLDTLAQIRRNHRVPLQELRKVNLWLRRQYETNMPWASLTFAVKGRKVFVSNAAGSIVETLTGQQVVFVQLQEVVKRLETKILKLRKRPRKELGNIVRHRFVAGNAYVLAGTRIPTRAIWQLHQAGYRPRAIIKEFPVLRARDVNAAIAFEQQRQAG